MAVNSAAHVSAELISAAGVDTDVHAVAAILGRNYRCLFCPAVNNGGRHTSWPPERKTHSQCSR